MKRSITIVKALIICFFFINTNSGISFSIVNIAHAEENMIESWINNHSRAATALAEWIDCNNEASLEIFKWDYKHPDQSREFVNWANTRQVKGIDVFIEKHRDWKRFNKILLRHRAAINTFVVWCRFHPNASTKLMKYPQALYLFGQYISGDE